MVEYEMMSLQTVPLYAKHWPPVVDILVQGKRREEKRREEKRREEKKQDNKTQEKRREATAPFNLVCVVHFVSS